MLSKATRGHAPYGDVANVIAHVVERKDADRSETKCLIGEKNP